MIKWVPWKTLGSGNFSEVYEATDIKTGQKLAVKKLL